MIQQRNYDSEFCGKVPLHQTNMIQPHGVLMIVEKAGLQILQVSENIKQLLQKPAREIVQTHLQDHISAATVTQVQERFAAKTEGKIPFTCTMGAEEQSYTVWIQEEGDYLLLEVELVTEPSSITSFIDAYRELKMVIAAMESAGTIEEASNIMIGELKRVSKFDRIMIYQFDSDWNGTVIAEIREPSMEPYLGLKFPASDIPKQARELYKKTAYRLIPNIRYEPVPLYPVLNPATLGFTNLSNTNLRSVATVHLEYLANMNVTASMSTRILKNGMLWGLISCHHRSPKYLPNQMCALFELLSDIFSAKVAGIDTHASHVSRAAMHHLYSRMVENIYKSGNIIQALTRHHALLMELLKADGIAFTDQKQVHSFGKTPGQSELEDLVDWLRHNEINGMRQIPSLSNQFEMAEQYSGVASGLLALPIQPEQGAYLLAFRPEAVQKVSWGGNPNEAVQFEADGKKYHPRSSFRKWQETVKGTAVPWEKEELEIAENFRNFVIDYTLNRSK